LLKKEKGNVPSDKVNTIIGKDTCFKGSINTRGIVRVDGELEGDVVTQSDVIIGESGKAMAEVKGKNVAIAGRVEGNVKAEGKMELKKTGALIGDATAQQVSIDDGAVFKGRCQMKSKKEVAPGRKTKFSFSRVEGNGRQGDENGNDKDSNVHNFSVEESAKSEDMVK